MYHRFKWTGPSIRRNRLTAEYEPLQPFLLMALAERAGCRTFVDVGANVGVYSVFSTLVPSIERALAFEADPDTLAELRANVALNRLSDRIHIHGKAVSSEPGTISFGVVGQLSGANSVVSTSIHDAAAFRKQVTVEATTLDAMLDSGTPGPLCIKVDVEGHEGAVIAGAQRTLGAYKLLLQIECYGDSGKANARRLEELGLRRLTAIGPDHYFSNIDLVSDPGEVIAAYERASSEMITFLHSERPLTFDRGGFRLEISGRSADLMRRLKRRLIG